MALGTPLQGPPHSSSGEIINFKVSLCLYGVDESFRPHTEGPLQVGRNSNSSTLREMEEDPFLIGRFFFQTGEQILSFYQ